MPTPPAHTETSDRIMAIVDRLSAQVRGLPFSAPVTHVYNPLDYARTAVGSYVHRYAQGPKQALFLGMNPGPFGMAQTGVPFGEVSAVRDWLGIETPIDKPPQEHADRPVDGFACHRREVSGERLWGFLRDEFGEAAAFFSTAFVWNYCPLLFSQIERPKGKGRKICRNLTPDKLNSSETAPLYAACDESLTALVEALAPRYLVGVGAFAEACLRRLFGADERYQIGRILHPSPASPLANRDFAGTAKRQLIDLGIWSQLTDGTR